MEALSKPPASLPPASATAGAGAIAGNSGSQSTSATGRAHAIQPLDADSRAAERAAPGAPPLRRGLDWNQNLQGDVARAQQALAYLDRIAAQLEALKSDLSGRLTGRLADQSQPRALETHTRKLAATLEARSADSGGGLDAQLDFRPRGARQRFRIAGLDLASLQKSGAHSLGFSVGGAGGPQLAATLEPGMTAEEIAARLDRTLAPLDVRASLDQDRQLVFSTPESSWSGVKDAIAVTGRGRVDTVAVAAGLAPQEWELGNPDALRQSLREVVQALARVRRSQDAATLALSAAMARSAQSALPEAELAMIAQDFAASAASHDYSSLLAITSALSGVSRDRVQALLGLR